MAAWVCFASSTGSPETPVSLNIMPIGARVESDRRARHPAASDDARLAPVMLDDRAVLEHREVRALLLGAPEHLAIGSLTSYMMWCSSTIAPADVRAQVPSIALRWRSRQEDADAH